MEQPDQYVSDSEREQAVASLREHLLAGRLTLEEFSERVERAYTARVGHELARARANLPERADVAAPRSRRKAMHVTAALFGRVIRRGRLTLRRWMVAVSAFSDLDLDLRHAELEADESSVTVLVAFANADVYVPDGVSVIVSGFGVFSRRRDWGSEAARADAPSIRVRVFSLCGTVDVWRVPSGMRGDYGEITRQLENRQAQLRA